MAWNIVALLLEGPHDAAFLYKILRANKFESFKGKLSELPKSVYHLLANPKHFSNASIDDMTIDFANRRLFPFDVLKDNKGENLLFLYPLQGDTNKHLRQKIISSFQDLLIGKDKNAKDFSDGDSFNVLYIWDCDKKGVKKRLEDVQKELSEFCPKYQIDAFEGNSTKIKVDDLFFGVHVVTEIECDHGRLEDILLPLMRDQNDDIFVHAETFLSIHKQTSLFKNNLEIDDGGNILKVNKVDYDAKKSLVGTVGQLQKSGMNNTVCIKQTDYLNDQKILANPSCQQLFQFIAQFCR